MQIIRDVNSADLSITVNINGIVIGFSDGSGQKLPKGISLDPDIITSDLELKRVFDIARTEYQFYLKQIALIRLWISGDCALRIHKMLDSELKSILDEIYELEESAHYLADCYSIQKLLEQVLSEIRQREIWANLKKENPAVTPETIQIKLEGTEGVYIVKHEDGINYKIGRSKNLKRRISSITFLLPFDIVPSIVIYTKNSVELERRLHKDFTSKGKRTRGEWYSLDEEDLNLLSAIKIQEESELILKEVRT